MYSPASYPRLHLDKETGSLSELRTVGLHRYAVDPTTRVWMFAYRFEYSKGNFGPTLTWWRDEPLPNEVLAHIAAGGTVVAHNAAFERIVWHSVMPSQTGWHELLPLMSIGQMDCTMARARAIGLPADLERAALVVKAPVQKDKAGGDEYMKKMMKPRNVSFTTERAGRNYWSGTPAMPIYDAMDVSRYQIGDDPLDVMTLEWNYSLANRAGLIAYCKDDVLAECGVDTVVPHLSESERELWELDQKINDKGVMIDVPFVSRLIDIVDIAVKNANARMWTLTGGQVKKVTEAAKLRAWLNSRGIECESIGKGEIDNLIATSRTKGDKDAEEAIALRNAASKSSTAKFKRALACIGADWRVRGQFVYHAATPGRWAGATVQLQNLVRVDEERDLPTIRRIVDIVETFDDARTSIDMITAL